MNVLILVGLAIVFKGVHDDLNKNVKPQATDIIDKNNLIDKNNKIVKNNIDKIVKKEEDESREEQNCNSHSGGDSVNSDLGNDSQAKIDEIENLEEE